MKMNILEEIKASQEKIVKLVEKVKVKDELEM